jgi:hypothetical protein
MRFDWNRETSTVEIHDDGGLIASPQWKLPRYEELKAFEWMLERAAMVYSTLERARQAFETGKADYSNAAEEVGNLIAQANLAAGELVEACKGVDAFFHDPISPAFQGKGNEFVRFCREFAQAQGPPEEVLGNSERAPGASSAEVPRRTAPSASDSSLGGMASPSAPASVKQNGSPSPTARSVRGR